MRSERCARSGTSRRRRLIACSTKQILTTMALWISTSSQSVLTRTSMSWAHRRHRWHSPQLTGQRRGPATTAPAAAARAATTSRAPRPRSRGCTRRRRSSRCSAAALPATRPRRASRRPPASRGPGTAPCRGGAAAVPARSSSTARAAAAPAGAPALCWTTLASPTSSEMPRSTTAMKMRSGRAASMAASLASQWSSSGRRPSGTSTAGSCRPCWRPRAYRPWSRSAPCGSTARRAAAAARRCTGSSTPRGCHSRSAARPPMRATSRPSSPVGSRAGSSASPWSPTA
mmetsp:Transcript_51116/g.143948  ORF Transcript_51116/g.143948 Transcript_51116/m.143948 type:complete len:287 (-) Transcript_51116:300-1160(-)